MGEESRVRRPRVAPSYVEIPRDVEPPVDPETLPIVEQTVDPMGLK